MNAPLFAKGQAWICPPTDEAPRLMFVIGRIDGANPEAAVIGVTVMPDPQSRAEGWPLVPHLPMSCAALLRSAPTFACADMKPPRAFEQDYEVWQSACPGEKGPVFDCPLSEAYLCIVDALFARPRMSHSRKAPGG